MPCNAGGGVVFYETIRRWGRKFGPTYARQLRRQKPSHRDICHVDEAVVAIGGRTHGFGARLLTWCNTACVGRYAVGLAESPLDPATIVIKDITAPTARGLDQAEGRHPCSQLGFVQCIKRRDRRVSN